MLLRFKFSNHRSFRDEQEFSLVASSLGDRREALITSAGIASVLPVAVIYGANASGKSNVFSALRFMQEMVRSSHREWAPDSKIPRRPFALDPESERAPSTFEVDLVIDRVRFCYGFAVDSDRVLHEWLFSYPRGRRQRLFERFAQDKPEFFFGKNLSGENRVIQGLTRANSLFLSAAAQNNHEQLSVVYKWFAGYPAKGLRVARPENQTARSAFTARMADSEEFRATLVDLLRKADLGVVGFDVKKEEVPSGSARTSGGGTVADQGRDSAKAELPRMKYVVSLRHRASGKDHVCLPFQDESLGTHSFFALVGPILEALSDGAVLTVDELDASIHPNLALAIVELFAEPGTNPNGAQLIFNTHDTNLLSSGALRRDQIWFSEKGRDGASHLYPLTDYSPRKSENLERGYLQGRYGAVPFLGDWTLPTRVASKK